MGDSYGTGLPSDGFSPWPVRVAEGLRREAPCLEFINLGRHGATSSDILRDQLPRALELAPDVVTVSSGANDVLDDVAPDETGFARNLRELLAGLRAGLGGATILTLTYGQFAAHLPFRERSRRRVAAGMERINAAIRAISVEAECVCVDIAALPEGAHADSYGPDGVHASESGHAMTAEAVMVSLSASSLLHR